MEVRTLDGTHDQLEHASPHFIWGELECKCGCGSAYISPEALDKLERLRVYIDTPLYINSAARCPIHNAKVGGAPLSQHRSAPNMPSTAFDISINNIDKGVLIASAKFIGFNGLGINYKSFVHVDDRAMPAQW